MDERADFRLCEFCRERQGTSGKSLPLAVDVRDCYICEGLSEKVIRTAERVASRVRPYEFKTFAVGLTLPPGVQEREDTLRSDMKIRGGETVKSELARRLTKAASRMMGRRAKKVDKFHPDLTVLADLDQGSIQITSKPLYLMGRYTKPRGVAQRSLFCEECNGRGCEACGGSGYSSSPSVEGIVSKRLGSILGSKRFKFTWFGSEDADSAVFPPGRPMVMESKSPTKRRAPSTLKLRTGKGTLTVSGLRPIAKKLDHPAFTFATRAAITAERKVTEDDLKRLRKMRNATVQFRNNKGRLVDKKVYFVKAESKGRKIVADIKLEGGLPVKRLVSGEDVSPSLSEAISIPLRCDRFDIMGVWPKTSKSDQ